MGYMCDLKATKKKPLEHIKKILRITFRAKIEIKDEVYCHVLKQMKDHPNEYKLLNK